jgi:3-oxoacyl-[acyl-carrier protein] reductase
MTDGRVALVTGAAGGIGRAIAMQLAADGYRVLAGDVADPPGEHPGVVDHRLDVLSPDSVAAAVDAARTLGELTAVVNCAGLLREVQVSDGDDSSIEDVIAVNLTGAIRVCRATVLHLGEGSAIVNIGSISSEAGSAKGVSAYAASKGGLHAYSRALACELGRRGIRVNVIAPGVVRAPMADIMLAPEGAEERIVRTIPLRRLAEPADIASAVGFLLSPAASYITGVYLAVDGGLLAT